LDARDGEAGAEKLDCGIAAWQQDVRRHALAQLARAPARLPSQSRFGALALLLLLHLVMLAGLRDAMRVRATVDETPIEVRLIPADTPEPPSPRPPPRLSTAAPRRPARLTTAVPDAQPKGAPTDATATAPLVLFNPDGSARLPAAAALPAPTKREIAAELMHRGHNIVHCRATRFSRSYKRDESLGDEISRKYLVWIGLYNRKVVEARAERRRAEAAAACDG
jgi:hypothetical protein